MKEAPGTRRAPRRQSPRRRPDPCHGARQPGFMSRFGGLIAAWDRRAARLALRRQLRGLGASCCSCSSPSSPSRVPCVRLAPGAAAGARCNSRCRGRRAVGAPALNIGGGLAPRPSAEAATAPSRLRGEPSCAWPRPPSSAAGGQRAGDLDDIATTRRRDVRGDLDAGPRARRRAAEDGGRDAEREPRGAVVEGDYAIASVRFTGSCARRRRPSRAFDEVWHVRQDRRDRKATWLIAGIQQVA